MVGKRKKSSFRIKVIVQHMEEQRGISGGREGYARKIPFYSSFFSYTMRRKGGLVLRIIQKLSCNVGGSYSSFLDCG